MPDITIKAADGGQFSAYLAAPKSGRGAGVLVIQEIFGVNAVMRAITDALAAQGYFALCPDIFWRQEPGIQLTDQTDAEWARAFELFKGFDEAKGIADLKAALAHLRGLPGCNGKAGTVGYCLGGRLVYLMACRSDADANASFYGVGIENNLAEASAIKAPTILHIAEKDSYVPAEAQAKIGSALKGHPHVTIHTYPGQEHAFARTGGKHYDKASADLANARTAALFKTHLG
ncbi:MAG: dienelactone hydrolase family protein [Alphaproteobacteria bacterium]|nr:dienelactone hydrolase family protein [Alphaproteobacteria bacterium]